MPPRIVILGGGFAGAYCAQALLRKLRRDEAEVTLIDRHNYFVFHPLLIEAGTGSLEPRHAVVPIRDFIKRGRFLMGEVESVDLRGSSVGVRIGDAPPTELRFDHLVVALGSVTRMPPVPGLREHGRMMKDLGDAVALRDRMVRLLEEANATDDESRQRELLSMVIVGGNFTGVEVAGEFEMFLGRAVARYPNVFDNAYHISLVESEGRILTPLSPSLSEYATKALRSRGIEVRLNEKAVRIDDDSVELSSGERINARTVIWTAGIGPNPCMQTWGLPVDQRGFIQCERDLRVRGHQTIWGIGDLAVNLGPDSQAYPATAQHAIREGTACAENLVRTLRGQSTVHCDLTNQGSIAALGCRTGVAQVFGIRLSGFPAWFLWRTVYLMKMPTLARKIRVALDWTLDLVFRPDIVELGVHRVSPAPTAPQPTKAV